MEHLSRVQKDFESCVETKPKNNETLKLNQMSEEKIFKSLNGSTHVEGIV